MKKRKNSNKKALLAFIFLIILVIVFVNIGRIMTSGVNKKECPNKVEGNPEADFKIRYFESPFCFYCWIEEPILKRLVEEKGKLFSLEKYDVRYCQEQVKKYKVIGIPTFVFVKGEKEEVYPGFISERNLREILCKKGGVC